MLSSAQYQTRPRTPNLFTTTRAQPFFAALAHELSRCDRGGMCGAAEASHWNSPLVANCSVNSHTSFRIRDVLHWTTNVHHARVVVAHESLVVDAPARQIGRQRVVPEIYRRLDEVIRKHAAADYAGVVVIELRRRDRHAWSNSVEDFRRRNSVGTRVQMSLQVTSDLIVFVPESGRVQRSMRIQQEPR